MNLGNFYLQRSLLKLRGKLQPKNSYLATQLRAFNKNMKLLTLFYSNISDLHRATNVLIVIVLIGNQMSVMFGWTVSDVVLHEVHGLFAVVGIIGVAVAVEKIVVNDALDHPSDVNWNTAVELGAVGHWMNF